MRDFDKKTLGWLSLVCCACIGSMGLSRAHAQDNQFVLIDATFTATSQNTMSSEYPVAPLDGAPDNWRAPIDYASGSVHVRVQVLDKPSDRKTLCNVCFFAADTLTCMPYPPPYTATGVYESEPEMASFWQHDEYDWTRKVERVNVVVKDENGRFVQGNPAYFPTKLHVTVTVIPPGEEYVAPAETEVNAGQVRDAGIATEPVMEPEPQPSVAGAPASAGGAGMRSLFGDSATVATAGAGGAGTASRTDSVSRTDSATLGPDAGVQRDIRDYIDPGSSCAVSSVRPNGHYGIAVSVALSLWFIGRVRRRARQMRHVARRYQLHN